MIFKKNKEQKEVIKISEVTDARFDKLRAQCLQHSLVVLGAVSTKLVQGDNGFAQKDLDKIAAIPANIGRDLYETTKLCYQPFTQEEYAASKVGKEHILLVAGMQHIINDMLTIYKKSQQNKGFFKRFFG